MPLLMIFLFVGLLGSSSFMSSLPGGTDIPPIPTPTPVKSRPSGNYCLSKEQFEEILSRPIAFRCDRTNIGRTEVIEKDVPWILAEENVLVADVYRKEEKQLILKEVCHGINYHTGKCHPHNTPEWGTIYAYTLWKLRDPDPNQTIKDGDCFDVYLRGDMTIDQIPARWICGGSAAAVASEAKTSSPLEGKMIRVADKSAQWEKRDKALKHDIEVAPPREKIAEITLEEKSYDVFINLLTETSPDSDSYLYLIEKGILPESNEGLPEEITYDLFLILKEQEVKEKTLKLATFDPRPPPKQEHGWWQTWIPESKPVVYLYPEKPTLLNFKINVKNGYITVSDPPYDPETGWEVMVYPNGLIQTINNQQLTINYPYLYYETMIKGYDIPDQGWAIKKQNLASFFDEILPQLGLNEKESQDFTEYWLDRFKKDVVTDYLFITFIPESQINEIDSFEISSPDTLISRYPDTLIRLRAYFKPLEEWVEIIPQALSSPPVRKGFTLVEWGGILDE